MSLGETVMDVLTLGTNIYTTEKETAVSKKQAELEAEKAIAESKAKASIATAKLTAESNVKRNMYIAISIAIVALLFIMFYKRG